MSMYCFVCINGLDSSLPYAKTREMFGVYWSVISFICDSNTMFNLKRIKQGNDPETKLVKLIQRYINNGFSVIIFKHFIEFMKWGNVSSESELFDPNLEEKMMSWSWELIKSNRISYNIFDKLNPDNVLYKLGKIELTTNELKEYRLKRFYVFCIRYYNNTYSIQAIRTKSRIYSDGKWSEDVNIKFKDTIDLYLKSIHYWSNIHQFVFLVNVGAIDFKNQKDVFFIQMNKPLFIDLLLVDVDLWIDSMDIVSVTSEDFMSKNLVLKKYILYLLN